MDAWRKQCLLAYLGYLPYRDIDDIWGDQTQEATKAFQRDYQITADGVFGDGTLARILEVIATGEEPLVSENQATSDSVEDNNVPSTTGTFWDEIEFFDREEFRCQCKGKYCNGFPVEPQEKMVRAVNEIRRRLGVPVQIVTAGGSGVRCEIHNRNVGGVENSDHKTGNAADLHSDKSPEEMARVAEEVMGNTGQIGIYSWGIHVGIGKYSRFNG